MGNDSSVIEEILLYEKYLWKQGFDKIIGLRDMYSREYRGFSTSINIEINERFIKGHQKTLELNATKPECIYFRFSIMELEAWFLGMYPLFQKMNERLSVEYINERLGYDLSNIDPENHFFKPAGNLEDVFQLVDRSYNKKAGDVESICSLVSKEDINELYAKNICNSFNALFDVLVK